VLQFSAVLFASLLTFLPPAVRDIERSFLAGDSGVLSRYFSADVALNVSFPDPIGFSDEVSRDQALFLFEDIFAGYKTFEFAPEGRITSLPGRPGGILKARWSFRDVKNGNPHLFLVFFYLFPDPRERGPRDPASTPGWKIAEIKAERL
jgi:hypothetical protein